LGDEKNHNSYIILACDGFMKFEIDMSGCDIFQVGAVVGLSDYNGIIKGVQLNKETIEALISNWGEGRYFCKYSKRGLGFFKAMVYSAIVCCLIESAGKFSEVDLEICRDLHYHENNIKQRLRKLIRKKLKMNIGDIVIHTLPHGSDIDNYVYLMFKDKYNLLPTYINPRLEDVERFLL